MEITQIINSLLSQVKNIDLNSLRDYSSKKNTINVIYIDSLHDLQSQQKEEETKKFQRILNQQYSYQLGIRGDGNCFYRAIMLMKIFCLAQDNGTIPLETFIQCVSDLKNIQIDLCAAQVVQGSDLQLIFRLFLMKILSLKQQKIRVDSQMIINEYNSLPEVDFAACSIARFMIYLSFQNYKNHPQIKAFIDEDIQEDFSKIILKQNEYAEGIIIPLAAQSFQCQLVIQNINYQNGSSLSIKKETLVYQPMELQQHGVSQIHLLFSKDHYDLLLLSQQCEQFPLFYKISPTKFNLVLQKTIYYQNFLLHKKIQLQKISSSQAKKNENQQSQSQIQQSQGQNDFEKFQSYSSYAEIPTSNEDTQKKQQLNPSKQNVDENSIIKNQENNLQNKEIIIQNNCQFNQHESQKNNFSINNKNPSIPNQYSQNDSNQISINNNNDFDYSKCVSCKKKIFSFSQFFQVQQMNSSIRENICKVCYQKIIQRQKEGIQTFFFNQNQYIPLAQNLNDKTDKINQQVEEQAQQKKQQFQMCQSVQFESQNFSNQFAFRKTQSEIQNKWDEKQNLDFQNFNTESNGNYEEICLQNSSFMLNQQTQQNSDKNKVQNRINFGSIQQPASINKNQVPQSNNQDVSIQEQQSILIYDSEEEEGEKIKATFKTTNNQYFTATLKPVNITEYSDLNQKSNNKIAQEDNKNNQKKDLFKCIKCKGPFKSQKYILQGKKVALLCAECLEQILKHLKQDQNSITIENQIYKFGDSIISRIKEQKLIEQSIKNNNIINPMEQVHNEQQKQNNKQVQQQINQFCSKLLCNFCNKNKYSTYQICEVLKGGNEKIQRVCTDCNYLFVQYYKHPSLLVSFDNKTYKISEQFSKYIYKIYLIQVQAEAQVQQYVEHREVQQKQKCIICNSFCKERNTVFNINDPQTQLLIGRFCIYLNLHCIKDNKYFSFEGNTYILGDKLKQDVYEHIIVQKNLLNKISK